MTTTDQLNGFLEQLRTCPGDRYVGLAGNIARQIADLPPSESVHIRKWIESLYEQIQNGHESFDVLAPFVQGLAARSDEHAAELLGRIMLDHELYMTEDVAEWLGEMGPKAAAAVPHLLHVLSDHEEPWPRAKAAYSLGTIGDTRAKGALIAALKDAEGNVRSAALDALVSIKEPIPEQEVLHLAEQDPDYLVRTSAIQALKQWYPIQAASVFEKLVKQETNPTVLKAITDTQFLR